MLKPATITSLFAVASLSLSSPAFADGMLQVELGHAIDQSRSIVAARLDLRAAVEDLPTAYQTMHATTSLDLSGVSTSASTNDSDFSEYDTSSVSVMLKKPLYDGGIADAEVVIKQLAVDEASLRLDLAEQNSLLNALEAYIGLVIARDSVALQEANLNRLEEYLRATNLKLDIGESTPTELAATKAQLARANASLIMARTDLANAEETYRVHIGAPPAGITMPVVEQPLPASPGEAGDMAVKGNISHRLSYIDERSKRGALDVLVANIRPKVDLSLVGKTAESSLSTRTSDELSASVTLSMPLFPNATVRARARSRVAGHRAAVQSYIDSERNTRLSAENAWRQLQATRQVIVANEAEIEAARLVRDGTDAEVEFGLKTVLDQLDAEQDLVNAEVSLLRARRDEILAAYNLMAAVGSLSAANLGIATDALAPSDAAIDYPVALTPLPVLDYTE